MEPQDDFIPAKSKELAQATMEIIDGDAEDVTDQKQNHDGFLPRDGRVTLGAALDGHENLESVVPDLWRLLFFLRSSKEGADHDILPDPMKTRQRVSKKPAKWHNLIMHQISLMDSENKQPAVRQGRQEAWLTHLEGKREKECPSLPSNRALERADLVAAKVGAKWLPTLVLSMWRNYKGGAGGGQLVSRSLARGSLLCARVVCPSAASYDLFGTACRFFHVDICNLLIYCYYYYIEIKSNQYIYI